jgi:hypothetical protein
VDGAESTDNDVPPAGDDDAHTSNRPRRFHSP